MPRRTTKSKAKSENIAAKTLAFKNTKKNVLREKCIKKELDSPKESVVEEVVHRKSERRRVARDIFLVFEEESNLKKKSRTNKKQTKPKFGHLKVEDPVRSKGLLRDIKNEPKCFLNISNVNATIPHDPPISKRRSKILDKKDGQKLKAEKSKLPFGSKNSGTKKLNTVKSIKIAGSESESCLFGDRKSVARVNPIFLWVKQDDTRIVEVRCEDYDRRNRIRITKTANGWRSIPRSDPSTSRILKFNPTPLMKVKRESNTHDQSISYGSMCQNKSALICKDFPIGNLMVNNVDKEFDSKVIQNVDTVCNPMAIKKLKSKSKKSKKGKKKSHLEKTAKHFKINNTAESNTIVNNKIPAKNLSPPFSTKSSDVYDFQVQLSTRLGPYLNKDQTPENDLATKILVDSVAVDVFKSNAQIFESSLVSSSPSLVNCIPSEAETTYQNLDQELGFYLCPKTGLFLRVNTESEYENESYDNVLEDGKHCFLSSNKDEFNSDIEKSCIELKTQISEENIESLEAKTKNLKDLLDEADLFQNCGDNTNSDADMIDNLVKTSCENNLIQANETIKSNTDQIQLKPLQEANEMVVQLIADVSEPPKCLSFNEAGEIEDLSDELFHPNSFMESFEKHSSNIMTDTQVTLHSSSNVVETSMPLQRIALSESLEPVLESTDKKTTDLQPVSTIEDSPKDLSYKKREEVCPQSESRSQCAVTSSSDVVKSPNQEDNTSMISPSETLKNLILEQFIKLNVLSSHHQRETTDNKQRYPNIPNTKSSSSSKPELSNNFETVVIDDDSDSDEEPLKKRLRLQKHKPILQNKILIDRDPDPLTQLRLLIKNTQWKVPDPILVPKDRLSAVLASPAREIPLLITTRPELRLPEAFAYPEIIQNPNILVISMAQLEAILKNEVEMEQATSMKSMKNDINQQSSEKLVEGQPNNRITDLQLPPTEQHFQHTPKHTTTISTSSNTNLPSKSKQENLVEISEPLSTSQECGKHLPTDSSSSDINSAAMTVLNQMLWLPYFGHISQEIGKYIKNPKAVQDNFSSSASLFSSQFNGIMNLEKTDNKRVENSLLYAGLQSFQQQFKTNEELSLFQKIVHHQMQSVLKLNQLPANNSTKVNNSVIQENTASLVDNSKSKMDSQSNLIEQRKKLFLSSNKQAVTNLCKNQTSNTCQNTSLTEKSYNLRSSVAGRHSTESKQYNNNNQRHISDNKPRLTCKSLSNLLDPEHSIAPSSSSVHNISGFPNGDNYKRNSTDSQLVESNSERKAKFLCSASVAPHPQKPCGNVVVNVASCNEIQKEKTKLHEQNSMANDATTLTADANVPLWHPLFGR